MKIKISFFAVFFLIPFTCSSVEKEQYTENQNILKTNVTISSTCPENFKPYVEVAGCYCEHQDKILFLKRSPKKSYGNTWGIPGGKLDKDEEPRFGAAREILEEIGVRIDPLKLDYFGSLYVQYTPDDKDYIFHRFRFQFTFLPDIQLNLEEHVDQMWATISEILTFPLMAGGEEGLISYQEYKKHIKE